MTDNAAVTAAQERATKAQANYMALAIEARALRKKAQHATIDEQLAHQAYLKAQQAFTDALEAECSTQSSA